MPKKPLDENQNSLSAQETIKQTEQALDHTLSLVDNSINIGSETLNRLHSQGKQIKGIETDNDLISSTLTQGNEHLAEMGDGIIKNGFRKLISFFRPAPNSTESIQKYKREKINAKYSTQEENSWLIKEKNKTNKTLDKKNPTGKDDQILNKEQDKLRALSSGLSILHKQAQQMGIILDEQNAQLDTVLVKTETNTNDLERANIKTRNIRV